MVQSVDYSAFIRQAFNGDKGLAGAITKLPLEKKFRLQTVKEVPALKMPCIDAHATDMLQATNKTPGYDSKMGPPRHLASFCDPWLQNSTCGLICQPNDRWPLSC